MMHDRRPVLPTLAVACPKCGARPGSYCVTPSGADANGTHADRRRALDAQRADDRAWERRRL